MKKSFIAIVVAIVTLVALTATAERKIWLYSLSGNHVSLPVTDLDSIGFEDPATLTLSEYSKKLDSNGGSFNLGIQANQSWKAESNNPVALTLSKTSGTGNDNITVTAMENTEAKSYSAIVTVTLLNGTYKQLIVTIMGTEGGSLKLDPEVKNLSSTGGRFALDIETEQAWTAEVSDPSALTLSKTSGTGNTSIYVSAVSNADTKPYTSYVTVELEDGTKQQLTVNVSVSDEYVYSDISGTKWVHKKGDSFDITVSSNTMWSIECDQPWVSIYPTSGQYNETITIKVDAHSDEEEDSAILTFRAIGETVSKNIIHRGLDEDVIDINGRSYLTVVINEQTWMAENLKCNKYDTQSEAYNASWLTNNTVPTSSDDGYTPYYADATDKTKWGTTKYADNLSNEQIAKLGYRYNWAAAVGVENGQNQTSSFSGNRQGICPNGWHVPTAREWSQILIYIEKQGLQSEHASKYIKSESGWYDNGSPETYPQGLDTYGFAALPAGGVTGDIGTAASFWTSTQDDEGRSKYAVCKNIIFSDNNLKSANSDKSIGYSVRCVKNNN